MSSDLERIIQSKRAWRRSLAQLPVAEKLALLDVLRDRARELRASASRQKAKLLQESPAEYDVGPGRG
ncbi:MAG: hypothetical protein HY675_07530 [Chloroflexi bacterium]|nr:hypothetical protein [Chloroflexota bacterium]